MKLLLWDQNKTKQVDITGKKEYLGFQNSTAVEKKHRDSKSAMLALESEMVPEPTSHTLQNKQTNM